MLGPSTKTWAPKFLPAGILARLPKNAATNILLHQPYKQYITIEILRIHETDELWTGPLACLVCPLFW